MADNSLNLVELKKHTPADLVSMAKDLEIENASTMRKGDVLYFKRESRGWLGYFW